MENERKREHKGERQSEKEGCLRVQNMIFGTEASKKQALTKHKRAE